jgi:hypothetical protein
VRLLLLIVHLRLSDDNVKRRNWRDARIDGDRITTTTGRIKLKRHKICSWLHRSLALCAALLTAGTVLALGTAANAQQFYVSISTRSSVYNYSEIPMGVDVPIASAVFDRGGYQLYDTNGETIVVPFSHNNFYVLRYAVSWDDCEHFRYTSDGPVLFLPPGAGVANGFCPGAYWYPITQYYEPSTPVYIGIAPSWGDFVSMGWYPGMYYRGGYGWHSGGVAVALAGLTIVLGGGNSYSGWGGYQSYYHVHPAPYHTTYYQQNVYSWAQHPVASRPHFVGHGQGAAALHPRYAGPTFTTSAHPVYKIAPVARKTFIAKTIQRASAPAGPARSAVGAKTFTAGPGKAGSGHGTVATSGHGPGGTAHVAPGRTFKGATPATTHGTGVKHTTTMAPSHTFKGATPTTTRGTGVKHTTTMAPTRTFKGSTPSHGTTYATPSHSSFGGTTHATPMRSSSGGTMQHATPSHSSFGGTAQRSAPSHSSFGGGTHSNPAPTHAAPMRSGGSSFGGGSHPTGNSGARPSGGTAPRPSGNSGAHSAPGQPGDKDKH